MSLFTARFNWMPGTWWRYRLAIHFVTEEISTSLPAYQLSNGYLFGEFDAVSTLNGKASDTRIHSHIFCLIYASQAIINRRFSRPLKHMTQEALTFFTSGIRIVRQIGRLRSLEVCSRYLSAMEYLPPITWHLVRPLSSCLRGSCSCGRKKRIVSYSLATALTNFESFFYKYVPKIIVLVPNMH